MIIHLIKTTLSASENDCTEMQKGGYDTIGFCAVQRKDDCLILNHIYIRINKSSPATNISFIRFSFCFTRVITYLRYVH